MEFETPAVKATYEKIAPWLQEMFGEFCILRDDAPSPVIRLGSTFTHVSVYPWGEDDCVIRTVCYVVSGAEITPALTEYLVRENSGMRFGAFGIDSDDDIMFFHTIVGSKAEKEEVRASVMAVALTCDDYDDKIVARFGGQRATDKLGHD